MARKSLACEVTPSHSPPLRNPPNLITHLHLEPTLKMIGVTEDLLLRMTGYVNKKHPVLTKRATVNLIKVKSRNSLLSTLYTLS
jgi:hypothetical protein